MAAHFAAAAFLVVAVGAADGAQPLRRRAQMGGWSGDADGVCEKRAEGMWPGSEDMSHLGIEQNPRLLQTLVTEQATDGPRRSPSQMRCTGSKPISTVSGKLFREIELIVFFRQASPPNDIKLLKLHELHHSGIATNDIELLKLQ